jgi:hypothetical protein
METLIFSSCWSNYCTFSSSSKMVQIYTVLSNSYVTSFASLSISSIWSEVCCSLFSQTLGGVIGLSLSLNFSISYLYPSIVYKKIFIFSFALLSSACMLSGMWSYTIVIPFSSLSIRSFSSSFEVKWLQVICNIYATPLQTSKLVASTWALDCTSCIILA